MLGGTRLRSRSHPGSRQVFRAIEAVTVARGGNCESGPCVGRRTCVGFRPQPSGASAPIMVTALVVLALLAVAAAAYWLTAGRAAAPRPARREAPAGGRFGSVEIRTRGGACEAARALEGQRFLAKDAPALPLAACSAAQCSCGFAKLGDRRTGIRRLLQGGFSASLFAAANRRTKQRDRRAGESARDRP